MEDKRISEMTKLEIAEILRLADKIKKEKELKKREKKLNWKEKSATKNEKFYLKLENSSTPLCFRSWFRDRKEHIWIKQCLKCGKALPLPMFARQIAQKDGLNKWCRKCFNADYCNISRKRHNIV
jgi:hypothetical protein